MNSQKRPWRFEKSIALVIALPVLAIIGCLITIVIAIRTNDGLVADDYYKQGLAINQTIARDEKAAALGLEALVQLSEGQIVVQMSANGGGLPQKVLLTLVHPTRSGADQQVWLSRVGERYEGPIGPLSTGRWQIRLEDEARSWRMNGAAYVPNEATVRILAGLPS